MSLVAIRASLQSQPRSFPPTSLNSRTLSELVDGITRNLGEGLQSGPVVTESAYDAPSTLDAVLADAVVRSKQLDKTCVAVAACVAVHACPPSCCEETCVVPCSDRAVLSALSEFVSAAELTSSVWPTNPNALQSLFPNGEDSGNSLKSALRSAVEVRGLASAQLMDVVHGT